MLDTITNNEYHRASSHLYRDDQEKPMRFTICNLDNTLWFKSPDQYQDSCHHFDILWIKKGKGSLFVDGKEYPFGGKDIYLLAPGQIRKIQWKAPDIAGYFISFSADFLSLAESSIDFSFWQEHYQENQCLPHIKCCLEVENELDGIVMRMMKEYNGHYYQMRQEMLRGLLKIFMISFSRMYGVENRLANIGRETELVRRFMKMVKRDFIKKKMVSDYANELCITPNYLNKIVKRTSGYPASFHIHQYIIIEAKRKAAFSSLTLKEIAYSLGFHDYAHFSKFFKNHSNISFSNWKRSGALLGGMVCWFIVA